MKSITFCAGLLLLAAGMAPDALSQTGTAASGQLSGTAGSALAGAGITVHMPVAADSTKPPFQYNATVKNQVTGQGLVVPAGAPALVKMYRNPGNPPTFALSLVSLTVNGQTIAVSGGSPSFSYIGAVAGAATSAVSSTIGGILNRGAKPAAPKPVAVTPAVSGSRVFVPAGSDVTFAIAQTPQTAQTSQPGQTPPPAPGSTPPPAPGSTPPPAPSTNSTPPQQQSTVPGSTTVVYENIQYVLQGCKRQAPHIICNIQITNQRAADAWLSRGQGSYYVDQAGNRVGASNRGIANCGGWANCQLLPGIAMAGRFEFVDEEGHATTLKRLSIEQSGKAVAQFTDVPVN